MLFLVWMRKTCLLCAIILIPTMCKKYLIPFGTGCGIWNERRFALYRDFFFNAWVVSWIFFYIFMTFYLFLERSLPFPEILKSERSLPFPDLISYLFSFNQLYTIYFYFLFLKLIISVSKVLNLL